MNNFKYTLLDVIMFLIWNEIVFLYQIPFFRLYFIYRIRISIIRWYFVNCFSYLNVLTRLCLFQLLNEVLLFLFCCNIWIGMPKNLLLITNQRVRLGPCWQIYIQTLKKMFSFSSIFLKDGFAFAVGWYTGEVEITCRVVVHIWSGILNP